MLPHARPGGIAGLLELLIDKSGRDDIYRLADDLAFEIDDLLPIVDAAQLLGFLTIEEGDAVDNDRRDERSPSRKFSSRRKPSARQRSSTCCCCVRSRARSIPSQTTRCPEEFFLDMLDEQFSQEETLRQLETAINWGRYAELFDFDASRRRFVRPEEEEVTSETLEEEEAK